MKSSHTRAAKLIPTEIVLGTVDKVVLSWKRFSAVPGRTGRKAGKGGLLLDRFKGKTAIVTGGASGIGKALCLELARRGIGLVVVADINREGAESLAGAIGDQAIARYLDVTRGADVKALVHEIVDLRGSLDYMFNNAGIATAGEVRDLAVEHWQAVLAVNLWGAIHGSTAAYEVMVRQKSGHIINMASMAGLVPLPLSAPYSTSKHAVVGLSTTLRAEGADLGVKVSVVCPAFVKTGIYGAAEYVGVDETGPIERIARLRIMDVDSCARAVLKGVERNKSIITVPLHAGLLWFLYRLQPAMAGPILRKMVRDLRKLRAKA